MKRRSPTPLSHALADDAPMNYTVDVDASREDEYWLDAFRSEGYYSTQFEYEDYAPAYCVGYTGFAQYGGSFEEAEKSLWANWERIKGDSRLPFDTARLAMRAAWQRMAQPMTA
jgi:hypothetical protein